MNAHASARSALVAGSLVLLLSATGCTSAVRTPGNLGNVPVGQEGAATGGTISITPDQVRQPGGDSGMGAPANAFGERFDAGQEEDISTKSLTAWRVATSHDKKPSGQSDGDWKNQRDSDEKTAMSQLQDLAKHYPSSSTVTFMMGQVEEHFGKPEKAAQLYSSATKKNTFNSMYVFKLAEAERQAGDYKQATEHYRKVLELEPGFYPAQLGLARCLLKQDAKSKEAASLVQQALANQPDDKDAQQLLNEIKGDKDAKAAQ